MKFKIFHFLLTLLFLSAAAGEDAPYRRMVNFEWEAIEDAKLYEIELKQIKKENSESTKTFVFKVKEPSWNGRLSPGIYTMKLRSHDYRGVPGEWSPESEVAVALEPVKIKFPEANAQISTKERKTNEIKFEWLPVGDATEYQFTLTSEDGKLQVNKTLTETEYKQDVPVAMNYTWKVSATNQQQINSEAVSVAQFSVLGKDLEKPKIDSIESEFVREIKWSRPDNVEAFDIHILKMSEITKKWEKFKTVENTSEESLQFDQSWPGGKYQIAVRGKAKMRPTSPFEKRSFSVRNGDRSPAAEYTATVRKSIDRVTGWYGIASYLITEMQFSGVNPEQNSSVSYSALGGTGRIGAGWFAKNSPWGFIGIADLSGFTFNGSTQTFASTEANAVYRKSFGDRDEVRFQAGPYVKELPQTQGDPFSGQSSDQKITSAGPHLGAEYWFSITPKLGAQLNAHLYLAMMKLSTPNGQDIAPTMSTQFGFLGSYRFTQTFTGLVGYARREDKMSYNALPGPTSFASSGDLIQSTIVGNYLNFFAEWAF